MVSYAKLSYLPQFYDEIDNLEITGKIYGIFLSIALKYLHRKEKLTSANLRFIMVIHNTIVEHLI
jgi:hypothetical protein